MNQISNALHHFFSRQRLQTVRHKIENDNEWIHDKEARVSLASSKIFVEFIHKSLKYSTIFKLTKRSVSTSDWDERKLFFFLFFALALVLFNVLFIYFFHSSHADARDESFHISLFSLYFGEFNKKKSSEYETALNIKYSCDGISIACLELRVSQCQCGSDITTIQFQLWGKLYVSCVFFFHFFVHFE